jgi:hypothetical protein
MPALHWYVVCQTARGFKRGGHEEAGKGPSWNQGGGGRLFPRSRREITVNTQFLKMAAVLSMLALPMAAGAQGIPQGAAAGARSGAAAGDRVAGPVGGAVGGAVGGVAGGVAGGVRGALGIPTRSTVPASYHHRHWRHRHWRHYRRHHRGGWAWRCRTYRNYVQRQRCMDLHGIPHRP